MKICRQSLLIVLVYLIIGMVCPVSAQQDGAELVKTGNELAQKGLRSKDKKAGQELFKSAMSCFVKAAKLRYGEGFYSIGWMFYAGHGVEKSREKCIEFYKKAIRTGYIDACYNVGLAWSSARLGEPDIKQAAKWFGLAAERGNTDAMGFLGRWHFTGKAGDKDYVKSRYYYGVQVKTLGEDNAGGVVEKIARLERVMTAAQIDEAQKLVDQFTPRRDAPPLE
jgi:TPR repeat protein